MSDTTERGYCMNDAVEQFLYMDPSTGLYRVSKPQCADHSAENQPAETMETLTLDLGWLCEGDEWQ